MPALRVESVTLAGVRCFRDPYTAQFAPDGLTVVHGPNEAGKSTLLAGIPAVIFGVPTPELPDWRADPPGDACRGVLTLRLDGETYTIERDFESHRTTVTDAAGATVFAGDGNPGGRAADARRYRTWLHAHFGFSSRDTFQETAFLHLRDDATPLEYGAAVRELVSGAGAADYTEVERALVDQYFDLTQENPWGPRAKTNPRRIEELEQELRAKHDLLAEADSAAAVTQSANDALANAQSDMAEAKERRAAATATLERLRTIQRLRDQAAPARERADRALAEQRRAQELDAEARALDARLREEFADVAGVRAADADALDAAERAADDAGQARAQADAWPDPSAPVMNLTRVAIVATVAILLATGVASFNLVAGIVIGAIGIGAAVMLYRQASAEYATQSERAERAFERKLEADQNAQLAESVAAEAWVAVPAVLRERTADEVRPRVRERERLAQDLDHTVRSRAALPDADALERAFRDATLDVAKVETQLDELAATDLTAADLAQQLQQTERTSAAAERDAAAADERRQQAVRALGRSEGVQYPPLALLAEDIHDVREQLGALRLHRDALRVAVDTLRDAARGFQEGHVRPIQTEAAEWFRRFTRDGWDVTLSEDDLTPTVTWRGAAWSEARLSAGTCDQLAVALRLAVIQALHPRVQLPLILDDPLAHWDAARCEAFRESLQTVGERRQVILATPDAGVAEWGCAAVQVDARASLAPVTARGYTRQ